LSLSNVGKSAGVFNADKLLDLNAWYIRNSASTFLAEQLGPFLKALGFEGIDNEKSIQVVDTIKMRSKTLIEMAEGACFYFQEELTYEKNGDDKFLKPDVLPLFEDLKKRLERGPEFDLPGLERLFEDFLEEKGIKLKKIAQPLRVALTGKTVSPGIFEVMNVLGKQKVLNRINRAISHIGT